MPVETITDPTTGGVFHLGRKPADPTVPKLRFAYYLDAAGAIEPPESLDLTDKATSAIKRMYLNDRYGCCVWSGKAHTIGMMTGEDTGTAVEATDKEIEEQYFGVCGRGDNGCVIEEVLRYMQAGKAVFGGKPAKVDAYCAVNNSDQRLAKIAMNLFGPLTLGLDLPAAWTGSSAVWDVTNSQIKGGHDVCTAGYDAQGVKISTWGRIVTMTWAAFTSSKWVTECWALMSPSWYGDDNVAPGGYQLAKLKADFELLKQGRIPEIDPPAVFYDFGDLA